MALVRVDANLEDFPLVPDLVAGIDDDVALCCRDGDTVMAVASLAGHWRGPVGVWLAVDASYPASMAARDAATLSRLVDLATVVVASDTRAPSHAEVVDALFGESPVDLVNDVAHLRGAYNRPRPPHPVTVWSSDGLEVRTDGRALARGDREDVAPVTLTRFE